MIKPQTKRLLITLFVPHYRTAPPDIDPGMGTPTKYNENHNNITRFGSDYLPYVSDTDTRPDSLTGIAYPAGDTLLRNVSHGNPNAELIKKWL
jgi:hypothetical protein